MKKNFYTVVLLLLVLCIPAALSGCSGGEQPGSTGGQAAARSEESEALPSAGAENVVMGLLSSVSGSTLEIERVEFQGMGAGPQGGSMPDRSDMPEGWQPGSGVQPPQMPEDVSRELPGSMPEGAGFPEGGFPGGGAGTPPTTGETLTVLADNATEITTVDSGEALSVEDLRQGDMLSVELAGDGKTALRISVVRRQADANTQV